jgi:ectoine hydroxylase-related dioxygenase (phytanoyl-CoA dioxygenase family)
LLNSNFIEAVWQHSPSTSPVDDELVSSKYAHWMIAGANSGEQHREPLISHLSTLHATRCQPTMARRRRALSSQSSAATMEHCLWLCYIALLSWSSEAWSVYKPTLWQQRGRKSVMVFKSTRTDAAKVKTTAAEAKSGTGIRAASDTDEFARQAINTNQIESLLNKVATSNKGSKGSKGSKAKPTVSSRLAQLSKSPTKSPKKPNNSKNNIPDISIPSLKAQLDYARNGHCVVRNALDPTTLIAISKELKQHAQSQQLLAYKQKVEVASNGDTRLAQDCLTITDCQRALQRLLGPQKSESLPFLQYFNTWRTVPLVYKLACQLAPTAAALMDVSSVRLYQDSLFWKRVQDGPTPWHADARMAPFDTPHMVTLWIPLHDIPLQDGTALYFVSKSHADYALPYWHIVSSTSKESVWNDLNRRYTQEPVHHMPLALGDYTAHSGWTLHCADGNGNDGRSTRPRDRMALAVSFVDGQAPIREDVHAMFKSKSGNTKTHMDTEDAWSYQDWASEVPAMTPGFEHKLVPIVYTKKKSTR